MRLVVFVVLLSICATSAHAASSKAEPSAARTVPLTRVETDQKAGVIRFIVNGREEARLDAEGFHVRGDVDYRGAMGDFGLTYRQADTTEAQHAR